MHTLIIGITGSGKSTLAKALCQRYNSRGITTCVLDPLLKDDWNANYITDDPDEFLHNVFQNVNCAVFVDESAETIGRYAGVMQKLATSSRNLGHNVHFICQRPKQLDINMRTQCEIVFVFKLSYYDSKELAKEYVADELCLAPQLNKGQYLAKVGVDGAVCQGKIF